MTTLPQDPYKILGIAEDAQLPEIRAAHRKLVKLCHPDKVGADASDDERRSKEDEFKKVQKAYEILSDENERRKYDELSRLRKFHAMRTASNVSAAAAAFASGPRRSEQWQSGGANVRTAEPRPETFSSRSPPKDASEQYHRVSRDYNEQARHDRPKPNIGVKHTADTHRARRTPSYESPHPSPTEESTAKVRRDLEREQEIEQEKLERVKREVEEHERDLKEIKRAAKLEKEKLRAAAEKAEKAEKAARKEERARKPKETYIEEPLRGSDDVYVSKSASKAKSSSKSTHKHRSSKHDRSRSRSQSRPEKPIEKKRSRDKSRLRAEIEEADDTDPGAGSDMDEVTRGMNQAKIYIAKSKGKPFLNAELPPSRPSAPTPPPAGVGVKPPPPMNINPVIIEGGIPRHATHPVSPTEGVPRLSRSSTAPQPTTFSRPIPIGGDVQYGPYDGTPGNPRGRSRSRLNQGYYPEDMEPTMVTEMRDTPRSRRGSSNTFAQAQGYTTQPRMYTVDERAPYYESGEPQYFPSGHSPKYGAHGSLSGVRHVPPHGPVPFGKVHIGPNYNYDDVNYGHVPHGYGANAPTSYA